MSRSLKVFEGSIIRSEKLFNLISQVIFFQYPDFFKYQCRSDCFFQHRGSSASAFGSKGDLPLHADALQLRHLLSHLPSLPGHQVAHSWYITFSSLSRQQGVFLTGKDGGQRSHSSFYDHCQVCAGMDQGERQLLLERFTKSIYGYLYKTIYIV